MIFWLGFRRAEIRYRRQPRRHGKSAWSFRRKFRYLLDSCFAFSDFALHAAADGTTILHPKQVIASFVTGGSAAGCGFFHKLAEGRILGGPPVLADYSWRMPGGIEKAWTFEGLKWEHIRGTTVERTRT